MTAPAYADDMARLCVDIMPEGPATDDVVEEVCAWTPLAGRILEIGSGYGRVLTELAARGYRCTGVEQAPHLHDLAVARAARRGVAIDLRCHDALDVTAQGEFDTVLIAGATFSLFPHADQAALLATCAAALRPGGRLFVDLHDADTVRAAHIEGHAEITYPRTRRGPLAASSTLVDDVWDTTYRDADGTVAGSERHFVTDVSRLDRLAAEAGMTCERVTDGWNASSVPSTSPGTMHVCRFTCDRPGPGGGAPPGHVPHAENATIDKES